MKTCMFYLSAKLNTASRSRMKQSFTNRYRSSKLRFKMSSPASCGSLTSTKCAKKARSLHHSLDSMGPPTATTKMRKLKVAQTKTRLSPGTTSSSTGQNWKVDHKAQ